MVLEVYPITKHQGMDDTGFVKNWWAGVETLTTLFIKEHNYLCGQLREVPIASLVLDMFTVSNLFRQCRPEDAHLSAWLSYVHVHGLIWIPMHAQTCWSIKKVDLFTAAHESHACCTSGVVGEFLEDGLGRS